MKCLIVLFAAAAVSSAQYLPFAHLTPGLRTQHHAQNEVGDYSFGYSGGPSSKQESRIAGVTQGSFSYVDAHGLVQSRSYAADPLTGFHVAGTDIPVDANTPLVAPVAPVAVHAPAVVLARRKRQAIYATPYVHPAVHGAYVHHLAAGPADTPEVAIAKLAHYQQYNYEALRNAHLGRRKRSVYAYAAPVHSAYAVAPALAAPAVVAAPLAAHSVVAPALVRAAPLAVAPAHVAVAPAVAPAVSTQYQAQDELGQYSYGYTNPTASKTETRYANGVTQGGYSYVDAHGLVQSASYVADPVHGFRVAATNLPIA